MSNSQANNLQDLANQLKAIVFKLDRLNESFRCSCDGNEDCPVCGSLVRLAIDADTLSNNCRSIANGASDAAAIREEMRASA